MNHKKKFFTLGVYRKINQQCNHLLSCKRACFKSRPIIALFISQMMLCAITTHAAALVEPTANSSTSLPIPVDRALRVAELDGDVRISFTMRFQWANDIVIVQRYDAVTKKWTILEGNPDLLTRRGRERLKKYKKLESKPGGLLYGDYRDSLKDVFLAKETEQTLTYSFSSPQAPSSLDKQKNTIATELVIDRQEGWMRKYSIIALKPFKANPVSRMDALTFTQIFAKPVENGPVVLTEFYCRMKGKNAFIKVDDEFSIKFSDFEIVN